MYHIIKLLYMKRGKELIAVKIIMASYFTTIKDKEKFANCSVNIRFGWCYLLPNSLWYGWVSEIYTIRFFIQKDYFASLKMVVRDLVKTEMLGHLLGVFPGSHYTFKESWKWNGHCAEKNKLLYYQYGY